MRNQKQVVHFQGKKGFTTAQSNEHQRNWTENGWQRANENGRIDRSRVHLNFEIVKGGIVQPVDTTKSIPQKFAENIRERGIKDPNAKHQDEPKFRTVVDFIISGSHDRLHELAWGEQDVDFSEDADNSHLERKADIERWAKDMYDVLCAAYGEENILSFIVHLDERTPHVHADLVPVAGNKISFNQVFCGNNKYEFSRRSLLLHDVFAAVNEKWGLRRDDSVAVTHAKHRSCEEYRRELSNECSALEREVAERSATLKDLNRQIRQAEIRCKGLHTMLGNLEAARQRVEQELDDVYSSLADSESGSVQHLELVHREQTLQKKLEEILSKLEDKRVKLADADSRLGELREQLFDAQVRHDRLQQQIRDANGEVSRLAMNEVGSEALWTVLREFCRVRSALPSEVAAQFDDTFLNDMSRNGMNIIACAALLSMGFVDQATNFADNCGGGGTRCDNDWGRSPDDDDQKWLRRCLAQSRLMMKPAGHRMKR